MKPLSEEELSEVAWQSFLKYKKDTDEIISTYCDGFKQGYAKCIEQMQDEFNELLEACHIALQNQTNVDINEIIHQMKGGEQ